MVVAGFLGFGVLGLGGVVGVGYGRAGGALAEAFLKLFPRNLS